MKKMTVLLLCILLSGCRKTDPRPTPPVVTVIRIRETSAQPEKVLNFTTDRETGQVLTYLRLLDFRGQAQVNPEHVWGSMYEFSITYSDGTVTTLRQKGDHYFMGADGQWMEIAPYSGSRLPRLMERENRTIE